MTQQIEENEQSNNPNLIPITEVTEKINGRIAITGELIHELEELDDPSSVVLDVTTLLKAMDLIGINNLTIQVGNDPESSDFVFNTEEAKKSSNENKFEDKLKFNLILTIGKGLIEDTGLNLSLEELLGVTEDNLKNFMLSANSEFNNFLPLLNRAIRNTDNPLPYIILAAALSPIIYLGVVWPAQVSLDLGLIDGIFPILFTVGFLYASFNDSDTHTNHINEVIRKLYLTYSPLLKKYRANQILRNQRLFNNTNPGSLSRLSTDRVEEYLNYDNYTDDNLNILEG